MLPLYKSKLSVFNYDEIPMGYYFDAMLKGSPIQRFWHQNKFKMVADKIPPRSKMLDFGCGPGSFLRILGTYGHEVQAIGVDIAEKQIDFAKTHAIPANSTNDITFLSLKPSDNKLPFDDHSFDIVTSIEVFEHIHPYS